jgi:hypothetical protein
MAEEVAVEDGADLGGAEGEAEVEWQAATASMARPRASVAARERSAE